MAQDQKAETNLAGGCTLQPDSLRDNVSAEIRERHGDLMKRFADLKSRWETVESERTLVRQALDAHFDPVAFRKLNGHSEAILAIMQEELDLRRDLVEWMDAYSREMGWHVGDATEKANALKASVLQQLQAIGYEPEILKPHLQDGCEYCQNQKLKSLIDAHPNVAAALTAVRVAEGVYRGLKIDYNQEAPNSPVLLNRARCALLTRNIQEAINHADRAGRLENQQAKDKKIPVGAMVDHLGRIIDQV